MQAKAGLAQSMAREPMPQGIHVAIVPIDAAIGWAQEDGTRAHRLAGTTVDDNMADPDYIAETYLQLHRQHCRFGNSKSCRDRGSSDVDRARSPGSSTARLFRCMFVPRPFGQPIIDVDDALSVKNVAGRPE
jgi:hypothetical protein